MLQKTEEKVTTLEATLQDFIRQTNRSFLRLNSSMIEFKEEMRDFKDEMRASRERSEESMQEFKERSEKSSQDFKEEMRLSRERSAKEMQDFKERSEKSSQDFKEEMRASRVELNKKWGDLANKMGTLVEDIMAPNIVPLGEKYFDIKEIPEDFMLRRKKKHTKDPSMRREFDIIAVYKDKVILNETKSIYKQEYIDAFAKVIPDFFDFFPEYSDKELIPIFASLYINPDGVKYATQKGIYVMATKGEIMDILNFHEVTGR